MATVGEGMVMRVHNKIIQAGTMILKGMGYVNKFVLSHIQKQLILPIL
jgi:hypothetical protein